MKSERWERLKAAYGAAIEPGSGGADGCEVDRELRDDLTTLLSANRRWGGTLHAMMRISWQALYDALETEKTEQAEALAAGQVVGPYTIVRLLGVGGMGEVFEAEQAEPRRSVALKVLRGERLSPGLAARLKTEAAILARLDHPGIARVIEAGILPQAGPPGAGASLERPYFTMDLVRGRPIDTYVREHGCSRDQIVGMVRDACHAVEHAHSRGVIHRDLKPSNILVDHEGRIRVLDFGIARLLTPESSSTLTTLGLAPGTLAYMSPEQASGDPGCIDPRSDVYSIGVLLYRLLTGVLPIDPGQRSLVESFRAIHEERPRRPASLRPDLRGDAEAVLLAALSKEPARRYPSAGALADDLGRLLRHEPLSIRPPSLVYELRVLLRRRWREAAVVGVVGLAGLGLAGAALWRALAAEKLAEQRLVEIRRSAVELVRDLAGRVAGFASVAEAREFLAGEAMARLERLAAEGSEDTQTLWALAGAYEQMGLAAGHPGGPHAGAREESQRHLRRACELRERVLAAKPTDIDTRVGVARGLALLAQVEPVGEPSLSLIRRSAAMYESVILARPDDPSLRHDLAYRLTLQASLEAHAGQDPAWRTTMDRSVALLRDLVREFPTEARWRQTLGVVLGIRARMRGGEDPAALVDFGEVREIMDAMLRDDPSDYTAARHWVRATCAVAAARASAGKAGEAMAAVDDALALQRRWYTRDPSNSMHRLDFMEALLAAATVRESAGKPEAGLPLATESRSVLLSGRTVEEIVLPEDVVRLRGVEAVISRLEAAPARAASPLGADGQVR